MCGASLKLGRHKWWPAWTKQGPKGSFPAFSWLTLRGIFRLYLFKCWRKGGDSERVVYTSQLEADRTFYIPVSSLWENAAADPKPLEIHPSIYFVFFVQFVDDLKALQPSIPSCLMCEDPPGAKGAGKVCCPFIMNDSQRKSSPDTNIDCKVFTESPGLVQTYDSSYLKLVQCYTTAPLAKNMFNITFEQEYFSSRGSCFKVSLHRPGNKDPPCYKSP